MPGRDFGDSYPSPIPAPLDGVLDSIRRMTAAVRTSLEGGLEIADGDGWWVLAVGSDFADVPFVDRDVAREQLRTQVEAAGIVLSEYVWLWDTENRAQLILLTLPTRERAERIAKRLRTKGLEIRVSPETF